MFFILSKVGGFFLQPLNAATLLVGISVAALWLGWRRWGLAASLLAFLILALSAWTTLGALLLHPLESRFARPDNLPAQVAGIVVLGGGLEGAVNLARGGYELNSAADRFVEAAVLARRFPDARIVISGGSGELIVKGEGDAAPAARMLVALGVARERLVLEDRSRNTHENARFTKDLVQPAPGETWLLVTSAFHMPRAVGLFREVEFPVLPWPVDFRTTGREGVGVFSDNTTDALQNTRLGIREWIGLLAYWLTGRTGSLLPAPA